MPPANFGEFLTRRIFNHIVWDVMLAIRHFISAAIVLALLAGGIPYLTCSAGMCAANVECASMRCSCCGPNCPWAKNSRESSHHSNSRNCNHDCPLVISSKPVTIRSTQPLALAMSGIDNVQPFFLPSACSNVFLIQQPLNLHPPTLLSLCCALTT